MRIWQRGRATDSDGVKLFLAASLAIGSGGILAQGPLGESVPAALLCVVASFYAIAIYARNAQTIHSGLAGSGAGLWSGAVESIAELGWWLAIAALCLVGLGVLYLVASWLFVIPLWAAVLIVLGVLILFK